MTGNGYESAETCFENTREIATSQLNFGGFYPYETTVRRWRAAVKRWLTSATRVAAASHGTKRAAASKVRNLSDRFLDTKATDDKFFKNSISYVNQN